jgi:hypothetical protein
MTTNRTVMTFAAALLLVGPLAGCNRRGEGDRMIDVEMTGDAGPRTGGSHEILGGTEYGSGEYAIILTGETEPQRYCWYIGETVRICPPGTRDDSSIDECIDNETNCLFYQPADEEREDTCYVRTSWQTVSGEALYGDCAHHAAYWSDDPSVECLYHRHCNTNELCVDWLCVCPEGTECGHDPGPPPPPGSGDPDAGTAGPGPGPGPSTPDAGPPGGGPGVPPAPSP